MDEILSAYNKKESTINIAAITASDCYVNDAFFVFQDDFYRKVKYSDILWMGSYYNYCDIHLIGGSKICIIQPLSKIEKLVPVNSFIRIHRSFVININAVDRFVGSMVYIGETSLRVSRQYHLQTFSCFNILARNRCSEQIKK